MTVALPPLHPFVGMDLTTALEQRAAARSAHPFVVWEPPDGERAVWTYTEFERDVRATAAGLTSRGIVEGDAVIIHLENCPAFLLTLFACARIGAVAVDLNTRYVDDELAHAIGLTGARGMVTDPRFGLADGPAASTLEWVLELDGATGLVPELAGNPDAAPRCDVDPGRPLCVQLTSGTTARPKAVLYTHANGLWGGKVGAAHWSLDAETVQFVYAPLFHTLALSWETLATFWVGGTVVVVPKFSASRFWDVSMRNGCTHTNLLPVMMRALATQETPVHSYRSWSFGLEMPAIEKAFGIRLFNAYGMTETVTEVIIGDLHVWEEDGAIGRPAPEYRLRVVRDDGTDVAPGETGDLLVGGVRGLSLFAEYLNDPVATADAFDEHGYFRTGDRVTVLPSGALRFASRAKDMLKVSGENVAAAEIERVITAVPGVVESGVVGRPDPQFDEVAVAFVVVDGAADGDEDALRTAILQACEASLADFKVPRDVYFVPELPRATLDKVAKATLREWARERHATPDP